MFNKKSLLIVGAGASAEARMPTGEQLKMDVANLLDIRFDFNRQESGDFTISQALQLRTRHENGQPGNINPYLHAAWRIRDAMPQAMSIDNFIDAHSENKKFELCGKLAIVRSILQAEKNSALFFDPHARSPHPDFHALSDTWYNGFFQLLVENCKINSLAQRLDSISLIVFNYDRCIEHYLYYALQNYYGINETDAAELMGHLDIYHPYGVVGQLPWKQRIDGIAYGHEPSAQQLLSLAHKIYTFTEGTDSASSEIVSIRRNVEEAEIVVFLGFAFHKLNMALIKPEGTEGTMASKVTSYYATAKGFSNHDCDKLMGELDRLCKSESDALEVKNTLTCAQLFNEYRRGLSLA